MNIHEKISELGFVNSIKIKILMGFAAVHPNGLFLLIQKPGEMILQ